ncbi:MAG: hypothetical protein PHY48_03165 [Candidatus Cloacimonetes bacterium]|nr:hypothetical protein [Candidatus Cloacimonadota bacterium]
MKNILKDQSGNIALAMLLVVIAAMSGLSISSMSLRDTIAAQAELESIQSLHFLRAETLRGQSFLEYAAKINPSLGAGLRTPLRSIAISGSHFAKTYSMQSKISKIISQSEGYQVGDNTGSTGASETEYLVQSLIETKTGIGQVAYFSNNKSIVRKYSELQVFQGTGPIFMYFTDNEQDPYGNPVRFDGKDYFDGPVHSNTDIWIRHTSGNPSGWPLFESLVTTSGTVKVYPAGGDDYPEDVVFPGGLIENYQNYEYPTQMADVRVNGNRVGPDSYDPNNIVMIKCIGSSYQVSWGKIQLPRREYADVWPNYPFGTTNPDGTPVLPSYRNLFTVTDTVWTSMEGGTSRGKSNFVNNKLWISGVFEGMQTWGAADTLFILGDIKLQNTAIGASPLTNKYDMVGLISEKSIVLKYGYMNPADSLRIHTNMGADTDFLEPAGGGVWIYAAMAALGDGRGNPFKDGVFTFEYQHPHGSIPPQRINIPTPTGPVPTLFTWIDLHRNKWPQTTSQRWPAWLDYPWYNPLWPEKNPYLMRGTINIWGGVNQRRRGFVRRNHVDADNPNTAGVWNPPVDKCGGSTSPAIATTIPLYQNPNVSVTLQTRHFPGAASTDQVGYRKNYNYDTRMYKKKPPDWPEFKKQGEKLPMEQGNWLLKKPPRALI